MQRLRPQPGFSQPSAWAVRKKYLLRRLVTRITAGPLFPCADGTPSEEDAFFFTTLHALVHRPDADLLRCHCCGRKHWFQFRRSLEEILGVRLRDLGRVRVVELAVALVQSLGL